VWIGRLIMCPVGLNVADGADRTLSLRALHSALTRLRSQGLRYEYYEYLLAYGLDVLIWPDLFINFLEYTPFYLQYL
jgi:hypothetical protein